MVNLKEDLQLIFDRVKELQNFTKANPGKVFLPSNEIIPLRLQAKEIAAILENIVIELRSYERL